MSKPPKNTRRFAKIATWAAIALGAHVTYAAAPATAPSADGQIAQWIQLLGSPDPTERDQAQTSLIQIGEPARPALKTATSSDDPAIAAGAAAVLAQLPWFAPNDPPEVRRVLANYNDLQPIQQRLAAVDVMVARDDALRALIRIVANEQDADVRWAIVKGIEESDDWLHHEAARSISVQPDSAPLLALTAWGWRYADPRREFQYLQLAFAQWKCSPRDPTPEERSVLFDPLLSDCMSKYQYELAVQVIRAQLRPNVKSPDLLFKLLALHADFGPLPGYEDDLALAGDFLESPLGLYTRSRLASKMMSPVAAEDLRRRALAAQVSPDVAYSTGTVLFDHHWADLAAPQFHVFLAMPPHDDDLNRINAWLHLGDIHNQVGQYQEGGDDDKAAIDLISRHPEWQITLHDELNRPLPTEMPSLLLFWHRLKGAEQIKDEAAVDSNLNALVGLKADIPSIVADAVPLLVSRGRDSDARALFDRPYVKLRGDLDKNLDDASRKDALASFCCQSGMRLEEADTLARQTVATDPTNAGYIDTLATCEFRLGRPQEAVRLETIALSIDRNNFADIQQLDRFRAAAAAQAKH